MQAAADHDDDEGCQRIRSLLYSALTQHSALTLSFHVCALNAAAGRAQAADEFATLPLYFLNFYGSSDLGE